MITPRFSAVMVGFALFVGAFGVVPAAAQRTDKPAPTPLATPRYERPTPQDQAAAELQQDFGRYRFYRPVVRIAQSYTLKAGDTVHHIVGVLGDVRIDGRVERDVVVTMGSVSLGKEAIVNGSLVVIGGSVTIESGAQVNRDLVVIGGALIAPPDFSPRGDQVAIGSPMIGDSLRALVPWVTRGLLWGRLIVPDIGWVWMIVGLSFLIGLVFNHVFDRQVAACAEVLGRRPLSAFLMGLLVLLLTPLLLTIVAASIIGLAVVPFAIAAFMVAAMVGKVGVTRAIGQSVIPETDSASRAQSSRSFVIGAVAVTLCYMLPVIGVLTWAMIGVFGLGSITMTLAVRLRRERPATPAPPPPPVSSPPAGPPPMSTAPPPPPVEPPRFTPPAPTAAFTMAPGMPDLVSYTRASFFDRLAAVAIDVTLVAIVANVFNRRWNDDEVGAFLFFLLAYHICFWAWKGTTLGGIICNLRIVRTNGANLRFVDAVVRALSGIFSVLALGIGCLWMLNDAERQMWHDKIAGTLVVKLPRELVLA